MSGIDSEQAHQEALFASTHDGWQGDLVDPILATELIRGYGVQTPRQEVVDGIEDAVRAAGEIGYPVVLKVARADIVHKTELGGVALDLKDAAAVQDAARTIIERVDGQTRLLVQGMAADGIEIIIGGKRDPVFGPVVLVGLGGIWAEAIADVTVRLAPVSPAQAMGMLDELRGSRILHGVRGRPAVDLAALSEAVSVVSQLIADHQEIVELDLNPVICRPDGIDAVDVRIIRDTAALPSSPRPRIDDTVLDRLFKPRSIAVVGASRDPRKQGGRLLRYLLKHHYDGELFAVNPNATAIEGCTVVASVNDLPTVPDLACIAVPSSVVVETVKACGERGVKMAIIFTAGFSEAGAEGDALQRAVMQAAQRYGLRLCGPNTAGVASLPNHVCATMGMAFEADRLPSGSIALLTQSGAIGGSLLSRLWDFGAGFSRWVSVGNEIDVSLGEYLTWVADDPETSVISMFIESIRNVDDFRKGCERARACGKAVLAYKTGASEAGRRAIQSHTAALAGDHATYRAAFKSLGVIEVESLQVLNDAAIMLSWQPTPRGRRIGVVSGSGGACSVVADECARYGLEVPRLSAATRARIAEFLPDFASSDNPVDVTMEYTVRPEMVGQVINVLLEQDDLDAVLVMMTTNADPPAIEVADGVVSAARQTDKPIVVARMGAEFLAPESLRRYREAQIPVFPMPDRAVHALSVAVAHGEMANGKQTILTARGS